MIVKTLGQVMTPKAIVDVMFSLKINHGRTLEPSSGTGNFSHKSDVCIEKDASIAHKNAIIMDFFDYPITEKFDTVIGNPPYVQYKHIEFDTKMKLDMFLFDARSNLYLFFIKKCIDHLNKNGELIFIVPRELMKLTSAMKLNEYMFEHGTIKTAIETGDERIFEGASPNCLIFRYVKDDMSHKMDDGRRYFVSNGQITFLNGSKSLFSDYFYCKVGAVSGLDWVFEHPDGVPFVYSKTRTDGSLKRMIYNIDHPHLEQYKQLLLNRKLKQFTEDKYYEWGRKLKIINDKRVYVNCKTRVENPFFVDDCLYYDGSILAVFLKDQKQDLLEIVKTINGVDWESSGFKVGGRYIFNCKSLENSLINFS